jgi:TldD protein
MDSKFKGLSDIALKEAKSARLQLRRHPLHAHDQQRRERERRQSRPGTEDSASAAAGAAADAAAAGFGGRRRGAAAAARRRGGGGAVGAAGFGVRVIHSGTWGFASSPIVTEDEIKRITRIAADIAKASAIAKKTDVRLAPVPAYQVYWATP